MEQERNKIIKNFEDFITPILKPNAKIAVYYPHSFELKILPLVESLFIRGFKILLPKISTNSYELNFYNWQPSDLLLANPIFPKIMEPIAKINPFIPDYLVLPLIACDYSGNRIGSGKGMYDRYLSSHRLSGKNIVSIALCYDFQLFDSVEREEHDQKLDYIVTNKRVTKL